MTPYALAMPEKYNKAWRNVGCLPATETVRPGLYGCVLAYRAYYRAEKRGHWRANPHSKRQTWVPAKWTRRNPPEWFIL